MEGPGSWHPGTVGYEIYVRSFADSSGDGIGDLEGIRRHLDHLTRLGVDALWITPFYPSPGHDFGYDVSDYTDVDPAHGSLEDFDRLVADAHASGLRVIVDLVANHSSSEHPWFRQAVADPDGPFRHFYIWRDPGPDGGPPNNWVSHFGGPAWTRDPASDQYYCHLFLPEQPDLNWDNPQVAEAFDAILAFWCERGVDGFRVDVAHGLAKDPQFRDNPQIRPVVPGMDPGEAMACFEHRFDLDQERNLEVVRRWRRVIDPYGAVLLAEAGADRPERVARYVSGGDVHHLAFFLTPAWSDWDPPRLLGLLRKMNQLLPDGVAWSIDNHDTGRSASRFGGGERGVFRSLAMMTLICGLGGMPFLYQGQELGLEDGRVSPADLADPVATRNPGAPGRDGSRTVMPWTPGPGHGFSETTPWLRSADRSPAETAAVQWDDSDSLLNRHRRLLAVRRSLPQLWQAPAEWLEAPASVGVVRRGSALVAANLATAAVSLRLPQGPWEIAYSSRGHDSSIAGGTLRLPAETALILHSRLPVGDDHPEQSR